MTGGHEHWILYSVQGQGDMNTGYCTGTGGHEQWIGTVYRDRGA